MRHYPIQWALVPFTLVTYLATLLILPFYRPTRARWYAGCLELLDDTPDSTKTTIWGRPGAQCWGIRVIWYNTATIRDWVPIRVHERVRAFHGELVNFLAHLVLVPLALATGVSVWWAIALGQLAFGISYGGHFLFEWLLLGFDPGRWQEAYLNIWTERIAYRVQHRVESGETAEAWGL